MMNLRAHRKMILVVSFLVAFTSVILVIVAGAMYYVQNGTNNWPDTQAEIVSSTYTQRVIPHISSTQTEYMINVVYQYAVNGNQVQCVNGQYYGKGSKGINSPSAAKNELSKYPVGKTLIVYYNPTHPSTCSLSRGVTLGTKLFLGISIALFVGSFATYIWAKNNLEPLEKSEETEKIESTIEKNPNLKFFENSEDT